MTTSSIAKIQVLKPNLHYQENPVCLHHGQILIRLVTEDNKPVINDGKLS